MCEKCVFGPVTRGYITGEPSRRCVNCGFISLDLCDEEEEIDDDEDTQEIDVSDIDFVMGL